MNGVAVLKAAGGFAIALTAAALLMPLALSAGRRYRLVVRSSGRSRSGERASYLGGPALALAVILATFSVAGFGRDLPLLLGALVMLVVGLADNRWGVDRFLRPALPVVVATAVWAGEFRTLAPYRTGQAVGAIALLVGAMYACRLLDATAGVAAGASLGAALGLCVVGLVAGQTGLAVLSASLAGAAVVLLRYSLHRPRLCLGDGGAFFVGLVLAGGALRAGAAVGSSSALPAALGVLAVLAANLLVVFLARVAGGRPVLRPARDHLAHRLMHLGASRQASVGMLGAASLLAAGSVALAVKRGAAVIAIPLAVVAAASLVLLLVRLPLGSGAQPQAGGPEAGGPDATRPGATRPGAREGAGAHSRGAQRAHRRLPPTGRRVVLLAGAVVVLGILAGVPSVLIGAYRISQARTAFTSAAQAAGSLDLAGAQAAFAQARIRAGQADAQLNGPLTAPIRLVPVLGGNLKVARALAAGAVRMAQAGTQATDAGKLLTPSATTPTTPTATVVTGKLTQIQMGSWQQASALLDNASTLTGSAVDRLRPRPGLLIPLLGSARLEFLRKGDQARSVLAHARDGASLVPVLFGADRARTFFVAIQNPDEMRGTGGLIGAFGLLSGSGGTLHLTRFDSDTALPDIHTPAPAPVQFIARYGRFGVRTVWGNINMSPDFPSSAALIASTWQTTTGTPIDGVISVDAQGLRDLLAAVGPVTVSNGDVITPQNFLPVALNSAYLQLPNKSGRVDYLLEVGREVWSRLATGRFVSVRGVGSSLATALRGKDLQVWIPGQEAVLGRLGVTGALAPEPGADYLDVVGQNAAANKVDYYAQRSIDYSATIGADGRVSATLSVKVDNRTPPGLTAPSFAGPFVPNGTPANHPVDPPALNRSYVSVYLPPGTGVFGATVDGAPAGVESETERGLAVVSRFLESLPGKSSTLVLKTGGAQTAPGEYRLVVQHQPTLNPDQFQLTVQVPDGFSVVGPLPPGAVSNGRMLSWRGILVEDREFVLHYARSAR